MEGTLDKIISFANGYGLGVAVIKFDPSGTARANKVGSFLNSRGTHRDTTASGTKQEMPVAEQSNIVYGQGARANLAQLQTTSVDGGGRDNTWKRKHFHLAGLEALRVFGYQT
jgi:hypothetical protein